MDVLGWYMGNPSPLVLTERFKTTDVSFRKKVCRMFEAEFSETASRLSVFVKSKNSSP